ncbi:hypothetical protein [Nocardioides sp.]|uniref:hypothetical protein n=1 Tax=Nocardioides sp. TaxID=35761 RepID=UPI0039E67B0D
MGDLLSRIEITKLAQELRVPETELSFLTDSSPERLRELRAWISSAMFARNEQRVLLLASLSRLLPTGVTAKIAKLALGPMLSARVAGVLDPREASRLAGHLDPEFLARLAVSLDPKRVEPIIGALDDDLVIDVGRRLLDAGEHLVLGRFVSVVDVEVAMGVVETATDDALLRVALFTEEPEALDAIVARLPDHRLAGVIRAAAEADAYDAAVTLLTSLSEESCARLVGQVDAVTASARDSLVHAIAEHDVWPRILPTLHEVEQTTLAGMVNVPTTADVRIVDRFVEHARDLDLAPVLVRIVLALDDAHLDVLADSKLLHRSEVQDWLLAKAGVSQRLVEAVLARLGLRVA